MKKIFSVAFALFALSVLGDAAPSVFALRNIAAVTIDGTQPTLPGQVWSLTDTGDTNELCSVTWNMPAANQFTTAASPVSVQGTVTAADGNKTVTASVRVVDAQSGSGDAENCSGSATGTILDSIKKGRTDNLTNTTAQPSGVSIWDNVDSGLIFENSDGQTTGVMQEWSSGKTITKIRACYLWNTTYNWCRAPDEVHFYSDAACTQEIATDGGRLIETVTPTSSNGDFLWYEYVVTTPQAITTLVGKFHGTKEVVLVRFWAYTGGSAGPADTTPKTNVALDDLKVDGTTVTGFTGSTVYYEVEDGEAITAATASENTGITILPKNAGNDTAYVVTVAEDDALTQKYSVYMPEGTVPPPPVGPTVFMLRNIAAVTTENTQPMLPDHVWSLTETGDTNELCAVTWNMPAANQFTTAASPVAVNGTVAAANGNKTVTASVRVASPSGGGDAPVYISDSLTLDTDGRLWDYWQYRITHDTTDPDPAAEDWGWAEYLVNSNSKDVHTDTLSWDTAYDVSVVTNVYLVRGAYMLPGEVHFYTDAECQNEILYSASAPIVCERDWYQKIVYELDPHTPSDHLYIKYTVAGPNRHISLCRLWVYAGGRGSGGGGSVTPFDSAVLNAMTVSGGTLTGFAQTTYNYTVNGATAIATATATENTGITILPKNGANDTAYAVTVSEDGTATQKYSVYMPVSCQHANLTHHAAVPSTCTIHGFSAWDECADCGYHVSEPVEQPLAAHTPVSLDTVPATCTEAGHHGGTKCSVCDAQITAPTIDAALGHQKVIDVEAVAPTYDAPGCTEGSHCSRCDATLSTSVPIPRLVHIIALRNIAAVTTVGSAPTLPETVKGLKADATLADADYDVSWNMSGLSFSTVDTVVSVPGTATVNGDVMNVTASVRVASAPSGGEGTVHISDASSIEMSAGVYEGQSNTHPEVRYSDTAPTGNTWGSGNVFVNITDPYKPVTFDYTWNSAVTIDKIRVYWSYKSSADSLPLYANGSSTQVAITSVTHYSSGDSSNPWPYTDYEFAAQSVTSLQFVLYASANQCTVARVLPIGSASSGGADPSASAVLNAMTVSGGTLTGFDSAVTAYTVENATGIATATATANTGITILPRYNVTETAYAVTLAEDGMSTRTYSVYMPASCVHNTYVSKSGSSATCTETGLTEELTCSICHEVVQEQTIIPVLGHIWDDGVITTQPTTQSAGVKTYTCDRCGATRTESIPKLLPVAALRNISAVTDPGTHPNLPLTVKGLTAVGEPNGDYPVTWTDNDDARFVIGDFVTVHGTVQVEDSVLPVTASVRVRGSTPPQYNVASGHNPVCPARTGASGSNYCSANALHALVDGNYADSAWETWNRYGNTNDDYYNENFDLTFDLSEAKTIRSFKIWYRKKDNSIPVPAPYVGIQVSSDNVSWTPVTIDSADVGVIEGIVHPYTYTFAAQSNVRYVKIIVGMNTDGAEKTHVSYSNYHYIALDEIEIIGDMDVPQSASDTPELSAITVNGDMINGFVPTGFDKQYMAAAGTQDGIAAESVQFNAGITILPYIADTERVYIVSFAEDWSEQWIWQVHFCSHSHQTTYGGHPAGCETLGDTGTVVCDDCGNLIEATQAIAANGHTWGAWVITKQPGAASVGEQERTCSVCGEVEHGIIDAQPGTVSPLLSSSVADSGSDGWLLTGCIQHYKMDGYYPPVEFGFVLFDKATLGEGTLTVNTPGRTKVTFSPRNVKVYEENGVVMADYTYVLKRFAAVSSFTVRPWMKYLDYEGTPRYAYGDPITVGPAAQN